MAPQGHGAAGNSAPRCVALTGISRVHICSSAGLGGLVTQSVPARPAWEASRVCMCECVSVMCACVGVGAPVRDPAPAWLPRTAGLGDPPPLLPPVLLVLPGKGPHTACAQQWTWRWPSAPSPVSGHRAQSGGVCCSPVSSRALESTLLCSSAHWREQVGHVCASASHTCGSTGWTSLGAAPSPHVCGHLSTGAKCLQPHCALWTPGRGVPRGRVPSQQAFPCLGLSARDRPAVSTWPVLQRLRKKGARWSRQAIKHLPG